MICSEIIEKPHRPTNAGIGDIIEVSGVWWVSLRKIAFGNGMFSMQKYMQSVVVVFLAITRNL